MFKIISNWLNKPFPFYETTREKMIVPLSFGLFVVFFLFLFNPFYNTEHFSIQVLKMFAYGIIAFVIIVFFNIVVPIICKGFFIIEKWNILKTCVFTIAKLLTIGLANGIFGFYFDNPFDNDNFPYFQVLVLYRTLIISIIPIIILIFWMERKFYTKYKKIAFTADYKLHNLQTEVISDKSETGYYEAENLKIHLNTIYFIKSDGNYSTIYFDKDGSNSKILIRTTLKEVEEQIKQKSIVRCHKSYIINLEKVSKVEGNARGYQFYIDKINQTVPVSRNLSKSVLDSLI